MKTFLYNIGYFMKEAGRTIYLNLLSNLFSILGTGLILFLMGMVTAGWFFGDQLVNVLSKEAEISAYFEDGTTDGRMLDLVGTVKSLEGVRDARLVDDNQARSRMEELLGEEAAILELFEDNPFEAFIEVNIDLENMDTVIDSMEDIEGIEYIRDNRDILEQIKALTEGLKLLSYLIILAVGITTIIIISHMIHSGIYNNREQISTMHLLGASQGFIGFPYVLVGLVLTIIGGLIAIGLSLIIINTAYGSISGILPFIPLPPLRELLHKVCSIIILVSVLLGTFGSIFGLLSIKDRMD